MTSAAAPSRAKLILAYSTIYLVWGSTYLGIRVAVETIPPFALAGLRFLLAGAVLFAVLRARGMALPTLKQWRDHAIIGVLLLVGGNGLVCFAEQEVPSGIAALVVAIGPVFTVLVEWGWPGGNRPNLLTFAGLGCGIAGVAWLMAPWQSHEDAQLPLWGVVTLLGACSLWSVGSIFARHSQQKLPAIMAAAVQMMAGGAASLVIATVLREWSDFSIAQVSSDSYVAFAYLVTIGSLVGFSTFAWLVKNSRPALVSTYAYVNPIVAVALGAFVLDEPISSRLALASVAIIASVALISAGRNRATVPAK